MEFDHELRLWLKSKNSRKTHLDTRVEAAQSDSRNSARHNTGRSAGIILTGVIKFSGPHEIGDPGSPIYTGKMGTLSGD